MERTYTSLKRALAGAIVVAALAGQLPASAQEATTTESTSTSTSAALARTAPRTTATPEMITDAIERSQSRTERLKLLGIPEQFGSEDPARFTIRK